MSPMTTFSLLYPHVQSTTKLYQDHLLNVLLKCPHLALHILPHYPKVTSIWTPGESSH